MKINKTNNIKNAYIESINNKIKKTDKNTNKINKKIDSIEISDASKKIYREIQNTNNKEYSEKVEKIRKEIMDNKYKVSSEEIANKLLEAIKNQEGID